MKCLSFDSPKGRHSRILCLGAHSDDIEIGCGGTLFTILEANRQVEVHWVVFGAHGQRAEEARRAAAAVLDLAAQSEVEILEFRDSFFPYEGAAIKEHFEDIKARFDPDLVLTHRGEDRHQDHRVISDLTWNTFRDHLILEYEIPKYDGDLGQPNVFITVSPEQVDQKVRTVLEVFSSQTSKEWFDADALRALLRLRGVESNAPNRYAEAFYASKLVLEF